MTIHNQESMDQEKHTLQEKPIWLDFFLRKTFFNGCSSHGNGKYDQNRYCITCDLAVCRHCIESGPHAGHNTLKVYRHIYKEVVPLSDIGKYIDCSKIQPYKCNKLWVVSLKPLPHNGSGLQGAAATACEVCKRILSNPAAHRYCSLACKVEAFSRKANNSDPPLLCIKKDAAANIDESAATSDSNPTDKNEAGVNKRKRPRKGIPCRAPMY